MGGTGNRAVLTLHKCNAAMVCLKILLNVSPIYLFVALLLRYFYQIWRKR